MNAKKVISEEKQEASHKYVINEMQGCWIAVDPSDPKSGFLLYNKLTNRYHAWCSEAVHFLPSLASGMKTDDPLCPVDKDYRPKADFLFLLTYRNKTREYVEGSNFVRRYYRELYFEQRRREIEAGGKTVSEANWNICMEIANCSERFSSYAAERMASIVSKDDEGVILDKFARWMPKIHIMENEDYSPNYYRFFKALEMSAEAANGVPFSKYVEKEYNKLAAPSPDAAWLDSPEMRSVNKNHGASTVALSAGFRSVKRHLHFEWLPSGGRGKSTQQKISGRRA